MAFPCWLKISFIYIIYFMLICFFHHESRISVILYDWITVFNVTEKNIRKNDKCSKNWGKSPLKNLESSKFFYELSDVVILSSLRFVHKKSYDFSISSKIFTKLTFLTQRHFNYAKFSRHHVQIRKKIIKQVKKKNCS